MKQKNKNIILAIIGYSLLNFTIMLPLYAHHHHHHVSPPKPVQKEVDAYVPRQSVRDTNAIPLSIKQNIETNQGDNMHQAIRKGDDEPALLLPNHYRRGDKGHLNAKQGWVNSKRQLGRYDIGINAPLPQTADPTQNKTRNVFRRAMPLYEPNY